MKLELFNQVLPAPVSALALLATFFIGWGAKQWRMTETVRERRVDRTHAARQQAYIDFQALMHEVGDGRAFHEGIDSNEWATRSMRVLAEVDLLGPKKTGDAARHTWSAALDMLNLVADIRHDVPLEKSALHTTQIDPVGAVFVIFRGDDTALEAVWSGDGLQHAHDLHRAIREAIDDFGAAVDETLGCMRRDLRVDRL